MSRTFTFQDPGEGIAEGEIIKILVAKGEEVEEGQNVLEVETDKAVFELASPFSGAVLDIHIKEGDMVHVGDRLFTFADGAATAARPREDVDRRSEQAPQATVTERTASPQRAESAQSREAQRASGAQTREEPVPASPATRRVARELQVDLGDVTPSGDKGRVLTSDVRAFAEARESGTAEKTTRIERPGAAVLQAPTLPDFSRWGPVERQPLRSVRRETAKRMALSWAQIPHVTHQDIADITELEAFRQRHVKEIKAKGGKLTLTVLIMKAVVAALHEYPRFNASLDVGSEELILKRYYNLGIALDSDRGLMVPVIRHVDRKSISELAVELFQLAERVRKGDVDRDDVTGGTFTITNPGPLGGTTFTPIINYPEVAILGLGRARLQPVVRGTPEKPDIIPRLMLPISFGFDHRVNDGADAGRFVNKVIDMLGNLEAFTLGI